MPLKNRHHSPPCAHTLQCVQVRVAEVLCSALRQQRHETQLGLVLPWRPLYDLLRGLFAFKAPKLQVGSLGGGAATRGEGGHTYARLCGLGAAPALAAAVVTRGCAAFLPVRCRSCRGHAHAGLSHVPCALQCLVPQKNARTGCVTDSHPTHTGRPCVCT